MLGLGSGLLVLSANRFAALAWVALVPLGVAVATYPPSEVASAAALAGAIGNSREIADRTMRVFGVLAAVLSAVLWAGGFGIAAWLMPTAPAWLAVVMPITTLLVHIPLRLVGAPRWHVNTLAQSQEHWLSVVHTGRLGGDLVPTMLMASAAAVVAMFIVDRPAGTATLVAAAASVLTIGSALAFGRASLSAATKRVSTARTTRVSTVVVNGPRPSGELTGTWPIESPAYKDVEGTIQRYTPHIETAVSQGAEIVVLPEVCVLVDETSRARWLEAVAVWARTHDVSVVAPFFDTSIPKNELVVVDATGTTVARYEKQHPVARLEGKRTAKQTPGPVCLKHGERNVSLSTVICVDLDYGDLVGAVRRAGGLLVAPSNDWPKFDELHHKSAVWSAVMSGVAVVRATGWGVSAAYDGAGRLLARATSHDQPQVLTIDVPLADAQ